MVGTEPAGCPARDVPDRPDRCAVGDDPPVCRGAGQDRTQAAGRPASGAQRPALHAQERVPVGVAAALVSAQEHGSLLLSAVDQERHLGADQRRAAPPGAGRVWKVGKTSSLQADCAAAPRLQDAVAAAVTFREDQEDGAVAQRVGRGVERRQVAPAAFQTVRSLPTTRVGRQTGAVRRSPGCRAS